MRIKDGRIETDKEQVNRGGRREQRWVMRGDKLKVKRRWRRRGETKRERSSKGEGGSRREEEK